jgi:ribonuclease BN (tRNA processing enzyme)
MIKLIFLGTKGEIEESNEKHSYNASLLLVSDGDRLLIDYGMLHKYSLEELAPDAILITHAHPDHYAWLKQDVATDVPVSLTEETLEYGKLKPTKSQVIEADKWYNQGSLRFLAYRVLHSIRCPAVGYKIKAQGKTLIYNSDLVAIVDKETVLADVDYYIGDGSSIKANLVRRRGDTLFGHTRITTQINWCKNYGIENIYFTHLGKETIAAEDQFRRDHPEAVLAYDGLEVII